MRKIFLFMHVSLDGYFEGPGHDISWFNSDDYHFEAFSREQSKEIDTLLFGRKTYELMKSFWPTPQAEEIQPEVAQLVVNPVALGEGTSLFKGLPKKVELTLTETRKFKSGAILLTYEPVKK